MPHQTHLSELWEMPDISLVERVFSVFFRSTFRLSFPVLDQCLFEKTVEAAYKTTQPLSHEQISARACVLAALSLALYVTRGTEASQGRSYVDRAQALCDLIPGDMGIVNLQTTLMLVSYRWLMS